MSNEKLDKLLAETNFKWVVRKIQTYHPDVMDYLHNLYPNIPLPEQVFMYRNGIKERPKCLICGNPVSLLKGHKSYGKMCSKSCSGEYFRIYKAKDAVAKTKQTKAKLYGKDYAIFIAKKIRVTCKERYGVEHPLQNESIKKKQEKTTMERHGSINPYDNVLIREKAKEAKARSGRRKALELVKKCMDIHDSFYQYPDHIANTTEKIMIRCPVHGNFEQSLIIHSYGHGCPSCSYQENGNKRRKQHATWFSEKAKVVHGEKYEYNKSRYTSAIDKIEIVCPKHGAFLQRPNDHLSGYGCPICGRIESKGESELNEFINSLGIRTQTRNRNIIPPKELDIFIPSFNLAIEYCGLYWHSERYRASSYHLEKHKMCEERGIRLVTLFEDEWKYQTDIVKKTIKHMLGKSEKGCYARNCLIEELNWKETSDFLNKNHLLGAGSPSIVSLGARDNHGNLISVMTFGTSSTEIGRSTEIEMKRFAVNDRNNPGVASKLLTKFARKYGNMPIIAYVDRRWFTGNFKILSGFEVVHVSKPSLWWTDLDRRYHRRFLTKKKLSQMLDEYEKSKLEMMHQLGYYRLWDCGKIKLRYANAL